MPLEAPVTRMTFPVSSFVMTGPFVDRWGGRGRFCSSFVSVSDDSAVGADDLSVDPVAGRGGQERDDLGNVVRGAEALQRGLGGQAGDGLLVLAVQEEVGG